MIEADENSFKETIKDKDLVLVDFYATWCGPCQMQAEVLNKLSASRSIGCDIVKINIDEAPNLALEYGVESIPTLMLFKKGEAIKKRVGLMDENELTAMVEEYMA